MVPEVFKPLKFCCTEILKNKHFPFFFSSKLNAGEITKSVDPDQPADKKHSDMIYCLHRYSGVIFILCQFECMIIYMYL